jgi:hypothetical protein
LPYFDHIAFRCFERNDAAFFGWQLKRRFVRIYFGNGLVFFDVIAIGNEPSGNFYF